MPTATVNYSEYLFDIAAPPIPFVGLVQINLY